MSKRSRPAVSDCRCGGTAQGEGRSPWGYCCVLPKSEPEAFSIAATPLDPKANGFVLDLFFYPPSFMPHAQGALAGAPGREGGDALGARWEGCTLSKEQTPADFNPCFLQYEQRLGLYPPACPCPRNLLETRGICQFCGERREEREWPQAARSRLNRSINLFSKALWR